MDRARDRHMENVLSWQGSEEVPTSKLSTRGSSAVVLMSACRTTNKENISSRAYIAFKTQEQVSVFGREYDGHVFQDKSGELHRSPVFRILTPL
jgi:hypothetical protein